MADGGLEEGPQTPKKQALSETGGAQSGAIRSDTILKELSACSTSTFSCKDASDSASRSTQIARNPAADGKSPSPFGPL